jgi:hypothetical protein
VRYRKTGEKNWQWSHDVEEDGRFKLGGLDSSGSYDLRAGMDGMMEVARARMPGEAPAPEPAFVTVRAGAKNVKLVVDLGGTLVVKVRDLPSSRSTGGLTASVRAASGSQHSGNWTRRDTVEFRGLDPKETYTLWIGGIPGGRYVLKDGLRAQEQPLTVTATQGGSISGVVKIPAEVTDLQHLGVSAYTLTGQSLGAVADQKTGRFKLEGLPEGGEWTVTVHAWSRAHGSWTGKVQARPGSDVEIVLKRQK